MAALTGSLSADGPSSWQEQVLQTRRGGYYGCGLLLSNKRVLVPKRHDMHLCRQIEAEQNQLSSPVAGRTNFLVGQGVL